MDQLWLPKTQGVLVEKSQEVEEENRALQDYIEAVEMSVALLDVSGKGQDGVGSKTEKTISFIVESIWKMIHHIQNN